MHTLDQSIAALLFSGKRHRVINDATVRFLRDQPACWSSSVIHRVQTSRLSGSFSREELLRAKKEKTSFSAPVGGRSGRRDPVVAILGSRVIVGL